MRRAFFIGVAFAALATVTIAVARLGPAPLLVNRAGMSPIVLARDGSLLVSDDGSNVIWKVSVKQ